MVRSRLTHARVLAGALAVALVLGALGCQRRTSSASPGNTIRMVFSNETMEKADVWVGALGVGSRRIGAVLGGETTTLRVPGRYYETGRLNVWTYLRNSPRTPSVEVRDIRPDEELRVRLPRNGPQLVLIR